MRHVFIVNPAAGKKRGALELLPRIHAAFAGAEEGAYAIRVTRGAGDATAIAREECAGEGSVRLYACGGDGTLTETATGAAGCPRALPGCIVNADQLGSDRGVMLHIRVDTRHFLFPYALLLSINIGRPFFSAERIRDITCNLKITFFQFRHQMLQ